MKAADFRRLLRLHAQRANVSLSPDEIDLLEAYFSLLAKWNARINLTALPLSPPTDETFERLFAEPLSAARQFPESWASWFDLGTGGGSPAIPLKIARPLLSLTMVEAKARKAAFLREALRVLKLPDATLEHSRFEDVARRLPGTARYITVRAVKIDALLLESVRRLLTADGELILFRPGRESPKIPGFAPPEVVPLGGARTAHLSRYKRMFHVEQSR